MTPFYMVDDYSGRNSFDKATVDKFIAAYPEFQIREVKDIPVVLLDSLFKSLGTPHLLCIDIEGMDYIVLDGLIARPKVICVENEGKVEEFDDLLKGMKYDKIFNTIGNGIYLHESCN